MLQAVAGSRIQGPAPSDIFTGRFDVFFRWHFINFRRTSPHVTTLSRVPSHTCALVLVGYPSSASWKISSSDTTVSSASSKMRGSSGTVSGPRTWSGRLLKRIFMCMIARLLCDVFSSAKAVKDTSYTFNQSQSQIYWDNHIYDKKIIFMIKKMDGWMDGWMDGLFIIIMC